MLLCYGTLQVIKISVKKTMAGHLSFLLISPQAQIRQQMSTRAEVLDEERKKAEVSLEGLKSKLKNLEEVQ